MIQRFRIQPSSVNYIALRSPWIPVWWSVALPGFGHMYMGEHLKGLILMSWEILVNHQAHLNEGIYYTLVGQADVAKSVLNYDWLLIYPVFYVFSMFDSYRKCVELNGVASLERLQPRRSFERFSMTSMTVITLARRSPTMAALWSVLMPGFGQLYNDRALQALALMGWYLAVAFKSGLALGAYHTLRGEFHLVLPLLNYQWLLFWPSIYIFGIADAYADTVEQNTIVDDAFRWRMRKYLRNGRK
jgi:TM2 domain-containing membrane protein YozV